MVVVRRVGPPEAEVLGALVVQFFTEESFDASARDVHARVRPFIDEPANAAFVAYDGDVPVGVATLTTAFGFETGRYGEIEELYVVPSWRGRGVARALVDAAIDEARLRGCHDVEIVVTPEGDERHGLVAFYARLGFTDTCRRILDREV